MRCKILIQNLLKILLAVKNKLEWWMRIRTEMHMRTKTIKLLPLSLWQAVSVDPT